MGVREHYIVMLTIIHPGLSGDHLIRGATLTHEGGGLMARVGSGPRSQDDPIRALYSNLGELIWFTVV